MIIIIIIEYWLLTHTPNYGSVIILISIISWTEIKVWQETVSWLLSLN